MGTKRLIILIGIIIVCTGGVLAEKSLVDETNGSTHTQWEYGVYRVGVGRHRFEWQDVDRRIYSDIRTAFLEKMGLVSINRKLATMNDAPSWALEYLLDAELLNHLGTQGWELVDTMDRGSGVIVNRIFWLKRHK